MTQRKDCGRRVGKSVGPLHRATKVVIEGLEQRTLLASSPVVDWSSFLGGSNYEDGIGIAMDGSGNAWVTGYTTSSDFASGGFDNTSNGGRDAFVAKIDADGTLAWSSYLGGKSDDYGSAIAIDDSGNAWVTGYTSSIDFASGGFDTTLGGSQDAFVATITADGTRAWSSYLGGSGGDSGAAIAIDPSGNAWVTGRASSTDFSSGGFDTTLGGGQDAFVAKINADGTLAWSSYLGGSGGDNGTAIAIDPEGNAWVTGDTSSSDLASGGFDTSLGGGSDLFVAKIDANGTLAWSSYLGGSGGESGSGYGNGISIDVDGDAWVTGTTGSTDLASGGFDTSYNGGQDAFVAKINADGTLAWSSYLGGSGSECDSGIALDGSGNAWMVGYTTSTDFAVGGFDTSYGGDQDAYVAKINDDGTLAWSTYLGGNGDDGGYGIAVDGDGNAWVTGDTQTTGFASGGFDTSYNGGEDAFVAKISDFNKDAPVAYDQSLTTAEDTAISGAVTATDPNGDALTYSVVSRPLHGMLSFQGDGTFTYTPASNYNGHDRFTFRANDGVWNSNRATVSITVMPGDNDAPTDLSLSPNRIPENQPAGTVVGNFSTTDSDAGDTFTYTFVSGIGSADNASFHIVGNRLQSAVSFDFETKNSYSIRVRTTDAGGLFFEKALTITVTPVNETPTDLSLSPTSIPENQPAGTAVGTLSTTDPDFGDTFSYSLVDGAGSTDNASFKISGDTLQSAAVFDFEVRSSYSIRIRSTDAGGLFIEKAFTIDVTKIALSNASVPENQPAGTVVGTLSTADPDSDDTFTYTLTAGTGSTDNARFTIVGDQLLSAATFDYETKSSYSIRVRSTDGDGLFFENTFVIAVTDVNEAPTDIILINTLVVENQPSGTVVGPLASSDPDFGDAVTCTYSLVPGTGGEDNDSFSISGSQILTAATFSLADRSIYTIRIRTTDTGGLFFEKTFNIHVVDIVLSNASVPEDQPYGTMIGTLSCSNPDAFTALTYTLVSGTGGGDNGSFAIVGNQLLTAAEINYEAKNRYAIRIRSSNLGVVIYESVYPITITNVNESPTDVTLSGSGVPEGQPIGTKVGRLSATDSDGEDTFTYTLVSGPGSDDNASFRIVGSRLVTVATFNYVPRREYAVRLRATDAGGLSVEKELGIPILVVFEFGRVDGRKNKNLSIADSDGDVVTFKLSGGGMGSLWGHQVGLIDTTATSTLSISVKKGKNGDGLYQIGDITSDGLLKSISAKSVVESGEVLLNSLARSVGKATASLTFRQITNANICVQGLPVASITVSGDVTNSRIVTTGSIKKMSVATLLDSDILVGVAADCAEHFATAEDFVDTSAKLESLKVSGRKLPSKTPHPAYVTGSHISAPTVGTITLLNVPATSDPLLHVLNDAGTLTVTQSKLTSETMFAPGTWKKPGQRPSIWQTLL